MLKFKKSLGQNFLIDKNICIKITKLTNIKNNEIIEIGPGKGILTDEIIKNKPKKITLIEKDKNLFNLLIKKYEKIKFIKIVNEDALKYDYGNKNNKRILISNLPYNISIKLIINWIKLKNRFGQMILMVQKEVAEKMNYHNSLKKNRLNLIMEISSLYNIEFYVSKNVFYPKPKIESAVIKIIPKKNVKVDYENFEKFTRIIFNYKRKKISNVINKKFILKSKINKNILEKRAEDLKTNELLFIYQNFYN